MYFEINELLGKNARPLPKEIRNTSLASETDADQLIGTYVLKTGPENTNMGKQIEISQENKTLQLKIVIDNTTESLMNLHSDTSLFIRLRR